MLDRWRTTYEIIYHVESIGIAIEGAEEGDDIDRRKEEVVIVVRSA
jgi:hypothetical protein